MILMYFTERPYVYAPEDEIIKNRGFFGLPNRYFDAEKGADLYNQYLDEAVYAEELGFDAVMLNEHHGTPFCMGSVMDVEAAILARITKKVKIILLGNPLPVVRNPIRLAEELAEIDVISRGRLVTGWVRGAGSEQIANNIVPTYNREYFNEAHDLVIKAWTVPGPFRFEGKHFHFRFVNPWVLPYQKPHPQVWIPGVLSPESVMWAAQHRYPYFGLGGAMLAQTAELWSIYAQEAARVGFQAGPEDFGYLQVLYVGETEEQAQQVARKHFWGGGIGSFSRPEWTLPPGYTSKQALKRLPKQRGFLGIGQGESNSEEAHQPRRYSTRTLAARGELDLEEAKRKLYEGFERAQANMSVIAGTPKTVIPKLRKVLEVLRPGCLALMQIHGPTTHAERTTSMRLFSQEVAPALREIGRELKLTDSFERQPGSRPLPASGTPEQVSFPDLIG